MKIPWSFPNSLKVLALIAGALLANTAFPDDSPPNDEDLILGGITLGYPLITPTQTGTLNYTAGAGTMYLRGNSVPDAVNYSATVKFNFQPTPALSMQFGVDKTSCIIDPDYKPGQELPDFPQRSQHLPDNRQGAWPRRDLPMTVSC